MLMLSTLDVPYTPATQEPLLRFDVHRPAVTPGSAVIVFVHGGAWRSEDKADHAVLAQRLAQATQCPVFVPNYRLTGAAHTFRHPGHAEDVLAFLSFILHEWHESSIVLIGHSCSAHMLASIFLDSDHASPSLSPPPQLLGAVKGIVLSEGIYHLDLLLSTFPAYRFVQDAFGARDDYAPFNLDRYQPRPLGSNIAWLLLHSPADTLIDLPQSQRMYDHLCKLYQGRAGAFVFRDFDRLTEDHDEIFRGDQYLLLVHAFVRRLHDL